MENITKLQDADGHWYWIPNELVEQFKEDDDFLCDKDYLEEEERFNEFGEKYGDYQTGGDPDLMPDFFKSKTGLDWINNIDKSKIDEDISNLSDYYEKSKNLIIALPLTDEKMSEMLGALKDFRDFVATKLQKGIILDIKMLPDNTKFSAEEMMNLLDTRGILIANEDVNIPTWKLTVNGLPETENEKSVPCLVQKINEWTNKEKEVQTYLTTQILEYNPHHKCWDNEDGDDYNCDLDKVERWITLSDLELLDNK